jgi:uncharacterized protein YqfB (UPF0267 family)
MSSFPAYVSDVLTGLRIAQSGNMAGPLVRMENAVPAVTLNALGNPDESASLFDGSPTPGPPVDTHVCHVPEDIGDVWFDIIHILPRSIILGNILTTITRQIDVYNAFLYEPHDLQSFINNAGAGTSITDLPTLPFTIPPQESLLLTLQVTPDGAPTINTTLDFDTDEPYLLQIPIQGTRIVMFPFEPETPLIERLQFLTDVFIHKDGTEQRVSLRKAPRQVFDMKLRREDGVERQQVDFLLFDWQSRVFGLPMWHEPTPLTGDVTAGATSINVQDTTLSDFRVGGLAIIYESETKFDALEVTAVGPTSISFNTPVTQDYSAAAGIRVMPLRTAITSQPAKESKYAVNLCDFDLTMRVLDNDVDLSDLTGWPTYNSKILLSDPNAITGTLDGLIERELTVFDGSGGGKFSQVSTWNRARHSSAKTFVSTTRSRLWAIRKLLHALRGRQVSFYLPTFTKDVTLASLYLSGSPAITIVNVGYTRYAKQRTPKLDLRIILNDGTTFTRTVTNSSEVDASTEQLTLSSVIAQNIAPGDVARIEFLEKVRIDSDEIVIEHRSANGEANIGFPVRVVLE